MNAKAATLVLAAVRTSGDQLMFALQQLKAEVTAEEFERWKLAMARSMETLYTELLEPICEEHPDIVPRALGGSAQE